VPGIPEWTKAGGGKGGVAGWRWRNGDKLLSFEWQQKRLLCTNNGLFRRGRSPALEKMDGGERHDDDLGSSRPKEARKRKKHFSVIN
jgi:hypothetical protein